MANQRPTLSNNANAHLNVLRRVRYLDCRVDVISRWILTVWDRSGQFQPSPTLMAADQKWCSRAVPGKADVFAQQISIV